MNCDSFFFFLFGKEKLYSMNEKSREIMSLFVCLFICLFCWLVWFVCLFILLIGMFCCL